MRHGKTVNHLGRTASHRKAMLSNMASSLILHKRITTTVAKAKELRKYVEPLLTRAKNDTTHSRRTVFSYLQNKESLKALFGEVAEKISTRPGGYTRIIKLGNRLGDNADMCMMELVDYNEIYTSKEGADKKEAKKSTRRAGKKAKTSEEAGEVKEVKSETKAPKAKAAKKAEQPVAAAAEETASAPEEVKAQETEQAADTTAPEAPDTETQEGEKEA